MATRPTNIISDKMAAELMARERDGRGLSATNANKLIAWKRWKSQVPNANQQFSGSSIVRPTPYTAKQASYGKAPVPTKPAPKPAAFDYGAFLGQAPTYGGSLPPVNPTPQVPLNIDLYNLRTADQLMKEAQTANNAVYNPLYGNLSSLIDNLAKGQTASEADRESRYNTQVNDLQRIYGTLNEQFGTAMGGVNQTFDQSAAGIQQATDQGIGQQKLNNERATALLASMAGLTGTQSWAEQGKADLARDDAFAQALLNNSNTQAQSMNSLAKNAANTWLTSLNEGTKSAGAMQAGQAQLARDRDISQIEQDFLQKNQEAGTNLAETQSKAAADLYELVRTMQSEDWTKYMDTREMAFNQGYQNAGLFQQGQQLSLEQAKLEQDALLAKLQAAMGGSSGAGGTQQTRLDQALNYLGEAIQDPKELSDQQYILRLLLNPFNPQKDINNAAGNVLGSDSFVGLYGDTDEAKAKYGARLYQSLADRGYVSGLNDPSWQAMQNALAILLTGTKKV